VQINKNVEFVAFVNEEPPFFHTEQMGSRVYVRSLKDRGKNIEVAVVLEMLGYYSNQWFSQRYPPIMGIFYPNQANFITVIGNGKSRLSANRFFNLFKQHSRFPIEKTPAFDFIPGIDFSDNWSFWQEGIPAIMITDTAFLRNKNYHKNTDTHETLNYQYMANVVKGIIEVLKSY
jgi:Zn-dependent M28 family amino/carboxypeptidase